MKAIVRYQYGSPNVLELREIDKPVVKDEGVLVRVHATSLNSGDLDYLYGRPLIARIGTGLRKPRNRGLGVDVAGQVEAVGKDVTKLSGTWKKATLKERSLSPCEAPNSARRDRRTDAVPAANQESEGNQ